MRKDSKQRLFEVMGRLDKTFKPRLNEDTFNDAGEPLMTQSQHRGYSEPTEPEYNDSDKPVQANGIGDFNNIDWKTVYDNILQNSQNPTSRDNSTVNQMSDYDGIISSEALDLLKWGDVGIWYDNGDDVVIFDVAEGESFPTYEEFHNKVKYVFNNPDKVNRQTGDNDNEAPYMRGRER